jgi:CubicO group peptidase (beta-lactamase class C family)
MTSMDEAMAWLADLPMEGQPGKVFHYSNAGLQIAGAVIEKISGESFQTLFAERIARPLEMKNTDFSQTRVALPAGGAGSTPEDYMNFLWMIQSKGVFNGHRILSENSVAEMQVNRITPDVQIAYTPVKGAGWVGYGFGEWIFLEPDTHAPSGSVSSPGLFGSIPWVDNKRGYCAFLMTFYLNNKGREERLRDLKKTVDEAVGDGHP